MEAGLSQAQLATKINEKPTAIVELENGHGRKGDKRVEACELARMISTE